MDRKEVWYTWKEFAQVEGEGEPRLLTPWGNPNLYEYPLDMMFQTAEEAVSYLEEQEIEREENWYLVKMIYEVVT